MYIFIYVHTYIYIHTYICTYIHIYNFNRIASDSICSTAEIALHLDLRKIEWLVMHIYAYVLYKEMYIYIYIYTYIYIYIYIHIYIHVDIYTYTYAYTYSRDSPTWQLLSDHNHFQIIVVSYYIISRL
jgi:hypothetical protein